MPVDFAVNLDFHYSNRADYIRVESFALQGKIHPLFVCCVKLQTLIDLGFLFEFCEIE